MTRKANKKERKALNRDAVEQTLALNPMVGISGADFASAARATVLQGIRQPLSVLRASLGYARKLSEVALGDRSYQAHAKDRRFTDPTWQKSPLHRGVLQAYLALVESMDEWVDDAAFDEMNERRARFMLRVVGDSIAPTNFLAGNPAALKKLIETGGTSLVRGARNFIDDQRNNNGMPSQVDKSKFTVGENIATTPGSVVFRNEMLELVQYAPVTDKVHRRPVLFVPPQINKFYVYDLSPEKSLFRYCVSEGLQTFAISWRNPGPEHADWGIDEYIAALKEALEVVKGITGSRTVNVSAACSGGITSMILAGHLNAIGDSSINSVTLTVCVLEGERDDNDLALFADDNAIELSRISSRRAGVLRGRELAKIFSWMRPNDLIWGYVVNNYILGNDPPAFDILYWNNDTTNLPAQLHSDFLDIVNMGALGRPGDLSVCDTDIDLTAVDKDMFIVGGLTDHLTPWQACYRTNRIAGGDKEFLLVGSGHIQSLVTDPGNPKGRYFRNAATPDSPEAWLEGAEEQQGSWWPYWSEWIRARSGAQKAAPKKAGSKIHPPLCDAPGTYVLEPAR